MADSLQKKQQQQDQEVANVANMIVAARRSHSGDTNKQQHQQQRTLALRACELFMKQEAVQQQRVMQLLHQYISDCTGLSQSAPIIPHDPYQLVWLEFRNVLNSQTEVANKVAEYVAKVRTGQCLLFRKEEEEDEVIQSLFPDYRYLLYTHGAEKTASLLPEICNFRLLHMAQIENFHRTARSDDCLEFESTEPPVQPRKELKDLEARKLHIVTKELIDELYEFFYQEKLNGIRATTGIEHVAKD